ncbi:hypothetical protein [Streptomyces meridianus]|uniref:DUF2690 domain-containing protein n=1 Tax=Streptomyces meridianus TaxID=2938945 RepID=A0ABT0X0U6_9ACTN|nr:hypothetical protein [Streptomyces meridianus]MCM2576119.1 hypothetical protein [Streptomyces meridianus]
MRRATKPAVVAGVLGGIVLMALGAVAAQADDGNGEQCTTSGNVTRCSYSDQYSYTTDDGRSVTVVSEQTLSCQGTPSRIETPVQDANGRTTGSVATGSVCVQNGRSFRS